MKKKLTDNPLKLLCIVGLIMALIISWGMVVFALTMGVPGRTRESAFVRNLREFDQSNAPGQVLQGVNPRQIERQLDRLQRQVRGIDQQLSVLKRRRVLAQIDRRYIPAYVQAARQAAEAFPYSAPIAAVAAEALLLADFLSADDLALLRSYTSRISQNRFDMLELSLHILAGDLDSPVRAAALPGLLTQDFSFLPEETQRDLHVNDFLLRANRRDIPAATVRLNALLNPAPGSEVPEDILRMAADFFYDHNSPMRAASIFLNLGSDADLSRAADAFVLAGEYDAARNIWLVMSSEESSFNNRSRSFYNLAASSANQAEEMFWLERLFALRFESQRQVPDDWIGAYGIVRYSRLLEPERSIAILDESRGSALLDLELHRRRIETWPQRRAAAETWQLVNRHSQTEAIYEWAAWFFQTQRLHAETARLFRDAERNGMVGSWFQLHRSLTHIREGRITEGEELLREMFLSPGPVDWRFPANLGRLQEGRRIIPAALDYYQSAAELALNRRHDQSSGLWLRERPEIAQLYMRIWRNLEALGRREEGLRALDFAYELDPNNINIRREHRAMRR